ncbi:MAG TPA: BamA/TamA family outer membrane protein, partial [Longimicrobium sp.]|nr:BamA/TamA family outer membrane protein [Longimicrobium sp.]
GPTWTRWGFRRQPHATQVSLRGLWAPFQGGYGVDLLGDVRHTNRPSWVSVYARASNFSVNRFHGFGNDSPDDPDRDQFEVEQVKVLGDVLYHVRPTPRLELFLGPSAAWTDPDNVLAATPGLRGAESFAQYGATAGGRYDLRDSTAYPRNGAYFRVDGRGYGSDVGTFGNLTGEASGYLSPFGRPGPTLAAKAGGRWAVGDFPFQEAAWIGGAGTVRGYPWQRFTGDAAVYGNAEVRQRLGRVNLLLARPIVGVYALGDAGRVYVDGDSPGDWHVGYGGGLSFELLGRSLAVSVAHGERTTAYVHFGMPF